jgi:LPXTG-motif cell wall-anchored protein
VSATVADVVFDGSKQGDGDDQIVEEDPVVTIQANSPKLYLSVLPTLPTAGGIGTGLFTICGAVLMALGTVWLKSKKKYEHEK